MVMEVMASIILIIMETAVAAVDMEEALPWRLLEETAAVRPLKKLIT